MSVEFEEENQMTRGPQIYPRSSGFAIRAATSPEAKLYLFTFVALMIGATLFIWLKFGAPRRPMIADTRPTPASALDSSY